MWTSHGQMFTAFPKVFFSFSVSVSSVGSDIVTLWEDIWYYTGEPIYFYMIGKNAGPNQVLISENY